MQDSKPFQAFFDRKRSIISVQNNDKSCLLRAVLIGKQYVDKLPTKNIYIPNNKWLTDCVGEPAGQVGIDLNAAGGIPELKRIEAYLKDYQITLYFNKWGQVLFSGPINDKTIYISYTGNHFNVINSMARFLNRNCYCHFCKIGFNDTFNHSCDWTCRMCRRPDCEQQPEGLCKHCGVTCNNDVRRRIHEENLCSKILNCETCGNRKTKHHVCGAEQRWCPNCSKGVPFDHRCYIAKEKKQNKDKDKPADKFEGFICFNYERYQDEVHIPNLIIAEKMCRD